MYLCKKAGTVVDDLIQLNRERRGINRTPENENGKEGI
jgi:hypothetical protein